LIGSTFAHYRLTASLGVGGMGEVYRATDTRLNRQVAIKVLPSAFTANRERLSRFEREAQLLAQLHHPNIASIFGLERADGTPALVMELVEGEDLAERLARGALPLDEALAVARQIAGALEAAHEKGIIHRDLKPANVKLRADGAVKVLDFGLAKAMEAGGLWTGGGAETSPTVTHMPVPVASHGTELGAILGTASYMAPEQARGKPVDRRADIWALGVVLWEMVTGRKLFDGETVTDILAAVVTREPDWRELEQVAGAPLTRVVRGCLAKDPRQRLSSAGDVALMLDDARQPAGVLGSPAPRPRADRRLALALLGVGLLLGGAIGVGVVARSNTDAAHASVERLSIVDPDLAPTAGIALSRDGLRVAYAVERDQGSVLAVRSIDRFDPVLYPGTEGATSPFFSPDGVWLGYFTRTELRKVPTAGGQPRTLASFGGAVRFDPWTASSAPTADWGADGTIVFSSGFWREPAALPGLFIVKESGGEPRPLTNLDAKELGHRLPSFTPDGRHVVFTALGSGPRNTRVEAVELETGKRRVVQEGAALGRVQPSGHLVYLDTFYSRLTAVAIDLETLEVAGAPVPLIEGVSTTPPQSFAISTGGTLVYAAAGAGAGEHRLVRVGLDGSVATLVERAGNWYQPRTSPDGRRLVVREIGDECRLWIYDLRRRTLTPLTSSGDNHQPIWMRNGLEIVYGREDAGSGGRALFRQVADGSRPPEVLLAGSAIGTPGSASVPYPDSYAPGDRALLFERSSIRTGSDLWVAPAGDGAPQPFLETPAFEGDGAFSPDGSWVAYVSDESGRQEVYVRAYPGRGGRTQISVAGGEWPIWSPDGTVLYFSQGRRLLAVDFSGEGQQATVGRPREVLEGFWFGRGNLDLLPDGESFVLVEPSTRGLVELRVVTGWTRELDDLVPATAGR
jgi:Tol biopolymer transport system component